LLSSFFLSSLIAQDLRPDSPELSQPINYGLDDGFGSPISCYHSYVLLGLVEKTSKTGTIGKPPRAIIRIVENFKGDPGFGRINVRWQSEAPPDELGAENLPVQPPKVGTKWYLGVSSHKKKNGNIAFDADQQLEWRSGSEASFRSALSNDCRDDDL
jgi:hypothetical protein